MHPTWNYLTHCTRRTDGPWPGQSEESYWDDLLWDRPESDHGPLATLLQILLSRCLRGSSRAIRGGNSVVCWTEVPGPELPQLHAYRKHRVRWDFCPYGICIQRQWLEQRGARPVIYAPPSQWSQLSAEDRPFFQAVRSGRHRHDTSSSGILPRDGQVADWRTEREWRTRGDLPLSDLPRDLGFLFVPSEVEAAVLTPVSPWPICTTGQLGPSGPVWSSTVDTPPSQVRSSGKHGM